MAVLYINYSDSKCGECGRGANPNETHHSIILEYGPKNGEPGCGALFTEVGTNYIGEEIAEATKALRPDLPFIGGGF